MRSVLFTLACFFLGNMPLALQAEEIFRHKSWSVRYLPPEGEYPALCDASTTNRSRQTFTIALYDDGNLGIFFFDSRWNIPERPLDFVVDIDYERWTLSGTGKGSSVHLLPTGDAKVVRFLDELASGSAVALYNTDIRRLATFSLAGSSAALLKLLDCAKYIAEKNRDPFRGSADPF